MTISVLSIGVDQSANHTGVALLALDGSLVLSALIEPTLRDTARLAYIYGELMRLFEPYHAKCGVWESYSMNSINQPFTLGEVGGVVQLALFAHCDRVEKSAPTALKKFITGSSKATKSEMVTTIETRWHTTFPDKDDNRADAYGLAQIGRHIVSPQLSQVRAQREVVHNIVTPKPRKKRSFRTNKGVL